MRIKLMMTESSITERTTLNKIHSIFLLKRYRTKNFLNYQINGVSPEDIASIICGYIDYEEIIEEKLVLRSPQKRKFSLTTSEKWKILQKGDISPNIIVNNCYLPMGKYSEERPFFSAKKWLHCMPSALIKDVENAGTYIGITTAVVNENELDATGSLPRYLKLHSQLSMGITGIKKWLVIANIEQGNGKYYLKESIFNANEKSDQLLEFAKKIWFHGVVSKFLGSWY